MPPLKSKKLGSKFTVYDYVVNTVLPISTLLPKRIANAFMKAVQSWCSMFLNALKDEEALMALL